MKYTEETIKPIFEAILEGVRKGDAVRKVLTLPDMPSTKTFYKWLENEDRGKQYARACEYRADAIFEEILNICDDKTEDYISTKGGVVGNNAANKFKRTKSFSRRSRKI